MVIENFEEVLMLVGKKFGDKIAGPRAKKRFGWTAKIFLRIVQNINMNDRNYSG